MKEVTGWKQWAMRAFDGMVFRFPMLSEVANQVFEKDLGLLAAWHFLSRSCVYGDYLEFGVFRGETFRNAIAAAHSVYGAKGERFSGRFIGFDSFAGLPDVPSLAAPNNVFKVGEFSSSRQSIEKNIGRWKKRYSIEMVEGWFEESLTPETAEKLGLKELAFVNIDCDLYESTQSVLRFIRPFLQTGTILYFDDWYSIKGSLDDGEAKACAEWLAQNPGLKLVEYRNVGIHGKMFLVNLNSD